MFEVLPRALAFQSTRPVKGATLIIRYVVPTDRVSIHAPREGRDVDAEIHRLMPNPFQSTRPVKGATSRPLVPVPPPRCFNPRAP